MLGPSHRIIGIASGMGAMYLAGISPVADPLRYAVGIACSVLGSYLPDADEPNSTIGHGLYLLWLPFYIFRGIAAVLGLILPPFKALAKSLGHRHVLHTPIFWGMVCVGLWIVFPINMVRFGILMVSCGILSHLFADMLTGGVPLFFPFSSKQFRLPVCFKTGGYFEFLATGASLSCILFLGAKALFSSLPF